MIVVKFNKKVGWIGPVYPFGTILDLQILALSCLSVAQHHSSYGLASEKSDIKLFHRADPVRSSLIIDLKT